MAADLDDLKRLRITAETTAWLAAEAHATGRSKHEIARDALHEIALARIRAARVLTSLAPAEARVGTTEAQSRDTRGRAGIDDAEDEALKRLQRQNKLGEELLQEMRKSNELMTESRRLRDVQGSRR